MDKTVNGLIRFVVSSTMGVLRGLRGRADKGKTDA
jgi:hypothetical protein